MQNRCVQRLTGQSERALDRRDCWSREHLAASGQHAQQDKSLWQLLAVPFTDSRLPGHIFAGRFWGHLDLFPRTSHPFMSQKNSFWGWETSSPEQCMQPLFQLHLVFSLSHPLCGAASSTQAYKGNLPVPQW